MHRLPPLAWTRTFEAAARLLSFTAAARELGITQSAVSQQIRLLEAHLGQPLFNRKGRGITLTEPGSRLFPNVRESFNRLARAYSPYLSADKSCTIWVSSNISFLMLWLLPRIPGYQASRRFTDFKFNTTRWSTDPKRSGASLDILYGDGDWPLASEILTDNILFPVCSPRLAERIREPLDVLRADLITTHGEEHLWREWAQAAGVITAGEFPARYGVDLHMAALELARLGHGIALANDLLAADLLASGRLAIPIAKSIRAGDNYYLSLRDTPGLGAEIGDFAQWLKLQLRTQQRGFRIANVPDVPSPASPTPHPRR